MIVRIMRRAHSIVACSGLAASILMMGGVPTLADRLVFRNSRAPLVGEVISDQPGMPIRFRYRNSKGEWVTASIPWSDVDHMEREEGDQSDGVRDPTPPETRSGADAPRRASSSGSSQTTEAVTPPAVRELKSPKDLAPLLRTILPSRPEAGELVVVRLQGAFDYDSAFDIGATITPGSFDALMEVAEERRPVALVLSIDSPGGLVSVMRHVIERTLKCQRVRGMRVVAWPSEAGSAAALLALSCREIVTTPLTRLGAANEIFMNGEQVPDPRNAGEQKQKAWNDALWQLVTEHTGRPPVVQRAMQHSEPELWHHPALGFRDARPSGMDAGGWTALDDDPKKPCVLTGEQLVRIGFAMGMATSEDELVAVLGLPPATPVRILDLNHPTIQAPAATLQARLKRDWANAVAARNRMTQRLDKAITKSDIANKAYQALPEQVTDGQLATVMAAVKEARTAIPSLRGADRAAMERWPDLDGWVGNLDFHTHEARGLYEVALKTLLQVQRHGGRVTIGDTIARARNHLVEAYNGPESVTP